jgi:hypothetical protein
MITHHILYLTQADLVVYRAPAYGLPWPEQPDLFRYPYFIHHITWLIAVIGQLAAAYSYYASSTPPAESGLYEWVVQLGETEAVDECPGAPAIIMEYPLTPASSVSSCQDFESDEDRLVPLLDYVKEDQGAMTTDNMVVSIVNTEVFEVLTSLARRPSWEDESIWDYFVERTTNRNSKNKRMECRACHKFVKGQSTSNFHDHQRMKCTGLEEAYRRGMRGICCDALSIITIKSQTTIQRDSGQLVQPFNHRTFLAAVFKWIIVSGLPFTTIQNQHLQRAFQAACPDARLQSARMLARKLEDTYDVVSERVLVKIRSMKTVIHFSHDSWTDTGRKHCYFGVYVSFINDQWEYEEVLLRLLHMKGSHTGERIGDGIFDLFRNVVKCGSRLGPGAADNAGNNHTASMRLADLQFTEYGEDSSAYGPDMVGCICHIANLAALAYLSGECKQFFG